MKIYSVHDKEFAEYGKVLTGIDCTELVQAMQETPAPDEVIYVPSDEKLEKLPVFRALTEQGFGGIPIQLGYCNGRNNTLNALEYHRSSEINVACTDLILLLGREQDIEPDGRYDTAKVMAFRVPAGTVIEVYATSLHYAPCGIDGAKFRCVVVLPRDTNLDLEHKPTGEGEDRLLSARNKWPVAHADAKIEGAFNGLYGENLTV